jgi:hypothetical protein
MLLVGIFLERGRYNMFPFPLIAAAVLGKMKSDSEAKDPNSDLNVEKGLKQAQTDYYKAQIAEKGKKTLEDVVMESMMNANKPAIPSTQDMASQLVGGSAGAVKPKMQDTSANSDVFGQMGVSKDQFIKGYLAKKFGVELPSNDAIAPKSLPTGVKATKYKMDKQGNVVPSEFEDPTAKTPTMAQETTGLYASRLKQANDVFGSIEDFINNQNAGDAFQSGLPNIVNFLKSGKMQSYQQAQKNFLNAVLRRESGAVISPSEFQNGREQYFPQPGDKPEVIAQKKANRDLVMRNFIKASGNAYVPYEQTDVAQTQQPTQGQITREQAIAELRRRGKI